MIRNRIRVTVAALLGVATALSACSASTSSLKHDSITISNNAGALWTCGFNPFQPSVTFTSFGYVYEPLVFTNTLKSGKTTPMLARSYSWSDDNRRLTFNIRSGVKWNDGKPLTAADVAFTFQLIKSHPGLDINSIDSALRSVSQSGNAVTLTFDQPAVPYLYYIADQVPIVPKHVWAGVGDPVKYDDAKPVGTGPLTVSSCSPQNITYKANESYWQPGLPKVKTVQYPAYTSDSPANTALSSGTAQWGGQFIPNIKSFYIAKNKSNHYWYPMVANESLFVNLTDPLLSDVNVRRAMSFAIDRNKISSLAMYGDQPPANQAGVVTPTFSSWVDKSAVAQYGYKFDTARAIQILTKAGYRRGSDGIFAKGGKKLSFQIDNIGGYSDVVEALQLITQQLRAAGIKVRVNEMSSNSFDDDLYHGRYQIAWSSESGGPTPFYEFKQVLASGNTAPIGQAASTNWERYKSSAADALLERYARSTDSAVQHAAIDGLQKIMLSDVPVIPIVESANFFQYNDSSWTGWSTPQNQYALPAPYAYPDDEQVLLHLRAK